MCNHTTQRRPIYQFAYLKVIARPKQPRIPYSASHTDAASAVLPVFKLVGFWFLLLDFKMCGFV